MTYEISDMKTYLQNEIDRYTRFKIPAIMQRFVLRNGHEGKAQPRPTGVRKRRNKACFKNAADMVFDRRPYENPRYTYVEGYALNPMHGLMIHHAWVEDAERNVIDPTWKDPQTCFYYGVPFTENELRIQLLRYKVYGLFDHGWGINLRLMLEKDPELEHILKGLRDDIPQLVKFIDHYKQQQEGA